MNGKVFISDLRRYFHIDVEHSFPCFYLDLACQHLCFRKGKVIAREAKIPRYTINALTSKTSNFLPK